MAQRITLEDTDHVYQFIVEFIHTHGGYPPSQEEIARACYMSRSAVQRYLDVLAAHGRIIREERRARGIWLP
jgi:response regulator of citrate/malate metabolism